VTVSETSPPERLRRRHWYLPKPPIFTFNQHTPRRIAYPRHPAPPVTPPCPKIAIVTPSYNQVEYIGATIDSVLTQKYPDLLYHVQDGGSTDGAVSVLKQYRGLTWSSEPDAGQADAINKGFQDVDCDLMGYLNSDDILLPSTLNRVANFFKAHPDIDIVYGHRIFINADGEEIGRVVYMTPVRSYSWDTCLRKQCFGARGLATRSGCSTRSFATLWIGIFCCGLKRLDSD
jgi:glycosyltransferase involved in cell wall biosynthesis